ncbi:DUF4405 domain-containing protein [Bacteroides sp. 519]|nr:DUF4405 domain-containing protein [Bacteroides sp. 519]
MASSIKNMETTNKKAFNRRKFVSVGLFLSLAILVMTGVLIQIYEHLEEGFAIHFFVGVHVLTGIFFLVISILHIIMNWRALKSYIKTKDVSISKETIAAIVAVIIIIFIGFLGEYHHL